MSSNSSELVNGSCGHYSWILLRITDDIYYSVLVTIILNIVLILIGSASNMAAIITIISSAEMRMSAHNTLLVMLAITDVLVALIAQPLFCITHLNIIRPDTVCLAMPINYHVDISVLLCVLSILTVSLICVETFFAIAYPLQHKVHFTRTRVLLVVGTAWVYGTVLSYSRYLGLQGGYFNLALSTQTLICLTTCIVAMFKTWRVILARRRRISGSTASSGPEITKRLTRRSAETVTIIVILLIVCYSPLLVSMVVFAFLDDETYFRKGVFLAYPVAETVVYLASCLDPFVYCYRNIKMRHRLYQLLNCQSLMLQEEMRMSQMNNRVSRTSRADTNELSSSGAVQNIWTVPTL